MKTKTKPAMYLIACLGVIIGSIIILASNNNATATIEDDTEAASMPVSIANTNNTYQTEQLTALDYTVTYDLPNERNDFFTYMDYRTITDKTTDQYAMQQKAWTNSQGIRCVENDVCISLGSYFGTKIGTRYEITLDTGYTFTAVLADCKADEHTDVTNCYKQVSDNKVNIIEFIVDTDRIDTNVKTSGNIGNYYNYNGQIISIQKIN